MAQVIKRSYTHEIGVFVDGISLDRASKRIGRRIDYTALLKSLTQNISPLVARYYTVIPLEDDSRHRSFLDAVRKAGFSVAVKRLPPKGMERQVSTDLEMAADVAAYAAGLNSFAETFDLDDPIDERIPVQLSANAKLPASPEKQIRRSCVLVCPTREVSYSISLAKRAGAVTTVADFGKSVGRSGMKSADYWIDLDGSELIWKEER